MHTHVEEREGSGFATGFDTGSVPSLGSVAHLLPIYRTSDGQLCPNFRTSDAEDVSENGSDVPVDVPSVGSGVALGDTIRVQPEQLRNAEVTWSGTRERPNLDRPALDEPGIMVRPDGRQIYLTRGGRPEADRDDTPTEEVEDDDAPEPTKRGTITGFSEDSRRRLRRKVHSLERTSNALFVTLTWHEELPTPERAKTALDTFWKRLRRSFPGISCIWKMEPQERGFPHFHLLIYGVQYIRAGWISQLWHEVTAETSEKHQKSGVDVEWVRDDGKLQAYLAEYFAETYQEWPEAGGEAWRETGRWWGVRDRKNLPRAAWADWTVYLDESEAAWLIAELLDEWDVDTGGALPPSLTINTRGDPTERIERLLDRL